MKKHLYTILLGLAVLTSCSHIDEMDRLTLITPSADDATPVDSTGADGLTLVQQNVLVEDFTGQKCKNCPDGAEAIAGIVAQYGADRVVPVAIHCGQFGFSGDARYLGLMNPVGKAYFSQWFTNEQAQPVAKVNRGAPNDQYDQWIFDVAKCVGRQTYVSIQLSAQYDAATRVVTISSEAVAPAGTQGYYQLWLVEDGIVGMQLMPNGKINEAYVHDHILRDAINGNWGQAVAWGKQTTQYSHSCTLPADCDADHCSIVAFLYDNEGVKQVAKVSVV